MKKPIRNVLAGQSNGTILYVCGKCGKAVPKDAERCPNCQARLGNIRCPFCNFTGSVKDFAKDTCPRCGRNTSASKNQLGTNKKKFQDKSVSRLSNRIFLFIFILLLFFIIISLSLLINRFQLY